MKHKKIWMAVNWIKKQSLFMKIGMGVFLLILVFLLGMLAGSRFTGNSPLIDTENPTVTEVTGSESATEVFAAEESIFKETTEAEEEIAATENAGTNPLENAENAAQDGASSQTDEKDGNENSTHSGGNGGTSGNSGSYGNTKISDSLAAPSRNGALQVKGSQLVDSSGNAVQLRGISTHGLAWYPDYVRQECFSDLHSWGANVIRLAMYTEEYGGYCSGGSQSDLKALVKKGVKYATAEDMYVIIDWHILSDGNPKTHLSEAKSFFKEMSAEFAGNQNVLYEICNEPNGGIGWSDIKSYAKEIIPVIRANDKDAIIIVGTPTWSQDVDQAAADPITGYSNIMYALHFYAATHKAELRNKMTAAVDAGLPVFVTEYGICDASGSGSVDTDSANQWVRTMDEYGISYVAWNLSNKEETSAIIASSVKKKSGFTRSDLSTSGKWVYDMLTKASGNSGSGAGSNGTGQSESSSESADTGSSTGSTQTGKNNSTGSGSAGSGSTQKSDLGTSGTGSGGTAKAVLQNSDLTIHSTLINSWESGGTYFYQYSIRIKNKSQKAGTGWNIEVKFNENISLSDGWNGSYSVNGATLSIKSMDYNGTLAAGGETGDIGFIVSGSSKLKIK